MAHTTPRIAVIGGGITGAFAAYFLARRGARATIIERGQIAGQASGHNVGGLNPLHGPGIPGPMQELALASLRLHLESWPDIRRLSGADFGGRLTSRLHVAIDEREAEGLASRAHLYNGERGLSARWLSGSELRAAEPRLRPDAVGGLWTEGNARVDPRPYTQAVAAAAVRLGARTVLARACGLQHRDGRVSSVLLDRRRLDCDGVVVACGPWCEEPGRWLGAPLPVTPVKGELLLVQTHGGSPVAEIAWRELGTYAARDGTMWLGGTEDLAGFDTSPTARGRSRILEGIRQLLPGIGAMSVVGHVAGLRPVSADGLPIIGIPSAWENVCLAVGSGRKGMLLAAGLGVAAAELLVSGRTGVPIGGCGPGRPGIGA